MLCLFSAIRHLVYLGDLPQDAEQTANFIEKMNDMFDIFNCFGNSKTPWKKPIYKDDIPQIFSVSFYFSDKSLLIRLTH